MYICMYLFTTEFFFVYFENLMHVIALTHTHIKKRGTSDKKKPVILKE